MPYLQQAGRQQLVGLLPDDTHEVIPEGAYITRLDAQSGGGGLPAGRQGKTPHTGFVTSAYFSPMLNRSFALALVEGGLSRMGEVVNIPLPAPMTIGGAKVLRATICDAVFIDKENLRRD